MREGELLGLKWSDINVNAGILHVQRMLNVIGGKLVFGEPKTALSRRRILLPQRALQALMDHRSRQQMEQEYLGDAWDRLDLVFPNTVGWPEDPRSFASREFKPLLRRSTLPSIRFHDLRHTAATLRLEEGINPKVVQEMLGHAHISTTLGLYAHITPTMLRAAARTMDTLFGE
jgi:integrase